MNILDAIASKRPFRRASRAGIDYFYTLGRKVNCAQITLADKFSLDDILADDWEIQEPSVTITRAQFWEAFQAGMSEWEGQHLTACTNFSKLLASKLGLGET